MQTTPSGTTPSGTMYNNVARSLTNATVYGALRDYLTALVDTGAYNPNIDNDGDLEYRLEQSFLRRATIDDTQLYGNGVTASIPPDRLSYLPLADFTIYNQTYHNTTGYNAHPYERCEDCNGIGEFVSTEMQGDPPMTGMIDIGECCDRCIGSELCPNCMRPLALSFDRSALVDFTYNTTYTVANQHVSNSYTVDAYETAIGCMPFVGFACTVCNWQYDPAAASEAQYSDYDGDYDDQPYDDYYERAASADLPFYTAFDDDGGETREDYEDRTGIV